MTHAEAKEWLPLQMDGRLDAERRARLDAHLATCARCRRERAFLETLHGTLAADTLIAEPEQLTRQILTRVATYEAQRTALPHRVLVLARDLGWRVGLALVIVLLAVDLTQPALWASLTSTMNQDTQAFVRFLLAPGPNSVAWGLWMLGLAALAALIVFVTRSEATAAAWVRSLAERLPQLW